MLEKQREIMKAELARVGRGAKRTYRRSKELGQETLLESREVVHGFCSSR